MKHESELPATRSGPERDVDETLLRVPGRGPDVVLGVGLWLRRGVPPDGGGGNARLQCFDCKTCGAFVAVALGGRD